jgi:hypothetical protein
MAEQTIRIEGGPIPAKAERSLRRLLPKRLQDAATALFGEIQLQSDYTGTIPKYIKIRRPPERGQTYGGGENITRTYSDKLWDERDEKLDFDTIDKMLRTGQVRFAVELKRAAVLSALFNELQWQIKCQDEPLGKIVAADLQRVFATYGAEMLTMLDYGCFFGELLWEYAPGKARGLKENKKWWVIEGINTVKPETVDRIERIGSGKDMGRFDGFVQERSSPWPEHKVPVEQALILTNRKKFRNLWGESILVPAYPLWYWFDLILSALVRYMDRVGIPLVVSRAPAKGTMTREDGTVMSTAAYGLLLAGEAARSMAVCLPSDRDPESGQYLWELDYLTDDRRGQQFIDILKFVSDLLTRSIIMGAMADIAGTGGGYNKEEARWAMTQLDNQMILGMLISQLSRYFIPKYAWYNATPQTYIEMILMGLDPEKVERVFKFLSTAGNQAGGNALNWPNWQEIFRLVGVPTLTEEEVEKLKKEKEQKALDMQEQMMKNKQQKEAPFEKKGEGEEKPPEQKQQEKEELEEVLWRVTLGETPLVVAGPVMDELAQLNPGQFEDAAVTLYNPYHDKMGHFATKAGAAITVGGSAFVKETFANPKWVASAAIVQSGRAREILRSPEEKKKIQAETDRALNDIPEDLQRENLKVRHHAGIGTYVSGAASVGTLGQVNPLVAMSAGFVKRIGDRTVNVSPMAVRALSSEDPTQRAYGRHVIMHESIHARKRAGLAQHIGKIPFIGAIHSKMTGPFEEGMTDLLASHYSGVAGAQPYAKYRDRMAKISMACSGGKRDGALQWLKDAHYRSAGHYEVAMDLRKAGYDVRGYDVYKYAHGGTGKLVGMLGKPDGYGARFTKPTRQYKGYWDTDTNLRRIATGTAEALAATYYRNQIYRGAVYGIVEAYNEWQRQEAANLEYELQEDIGNPKDWDLDLSAMALAIGEDGVLGIINDMPEEDREAAILMLGLGFDAIPWSMVNEERGLEEDVGPFELGNPYHDEQGRFTTRERAVTGAGIRSGGEGKKQVRGKGQGPIGEPKKQEGPKGEPQYLKSGRVSYGTISGKVIDKKQFEKNYQATGKELSKRLPGCDKQPPIVVQDIPGVKGFYYGAYYKGDIYVAGNFAHAVATKEPGFGHHMLIHEQIHARKRTNLKGFPGGDWQEEGATELLARKMYKDIYGSPSPSNCYNPYVKRIARTAWAQSGGNPKEAWAYIDRLHNKEVGFKEVKNGKGWEAMIDAEYKFEEEEDLGQQLLDLIEQKKWEEAEAFIKEHPEDYLILMYGEAWIVEHGIEEGGEE